MLTLFRRSSAVKRSAMIPLSGFGSFVSRARECYGCRSCEIAGESLMVRQFGLVCLLGGALIGSVSSASAFGPVISLGQSASTQDDLLEASFFGRPYPYGYTGWGPCI